MKNITGNVIFTLNAGTQCIYGRCTIFQAKTT